MSSKTDREIDRFVAFWTIENFTKCMEEGGQIEYHLADSNIDVHRFATVCTHYIDEMSNYDTEFVVWFIQKTRKVMCHFDPVKRDLMKNINVN